MIIKYALRTCIHSSYTAFKSVMNKQTASYLGIGIVAVISAFASGLAIGSADLPDRTLPSKEMPVAPEIKTPIDIPLGAIKYNCELSGGIFKDNHCICSIEDFQTQEMMYDKNTGFCQSTHGGPAGDAFFASSGLPFGYYSFWMGIMMDLCETSGGSISGVACICPSEKTFSKTNGKCQ